MGQSAENILDELLVKSLALDSALDGIAILEDGRYVYLNHSHATLYGYDSPAELVGKSWKVLYDTDELKRFEEEIMPNLFARGHIRVECIGKRKDGSPWPQDLSLTTVEGGGLICVVRDISKRKHAIHEVERMKLIFQGNPNPVFTFDRRGVIGFANPSSSELFVLTTPTEINIRDIVAGMESIDLQRCIDRGEIIPTSGNSNGKFFQFVLRGFPDLDLGCAYGMDITELKRSERDLRRSKRFLRKVIDLVPNFIFVKDREGRFVLANQSVADAYGTSTSEIIGRTDHDLNPEKDETDWFRRDDLEVIDTLSEKFIPEEKITDASGKVRWLSTVKRPFRFAPNEPVNVLGVSTDVSEIRLLQDQLLQIQKMEAIGQLAGGVAHDFNNLLTAILGYSEVLKLGSARGSQTYHSADMIENAANRARQLTEKLLGFARKGKHQNISIDLHSCVQDTLAILQRTMDPSIQISEFLHAERHHILGDPVQIQQVILNLAINARDAMSTAQTEGQRKILSIITRNIRMDEGTEEEAEGIELFVRDTGCGIDSAVKDKIFEPFFTTKEPGRGTGLGLSMVYGIVKNHGGLVTVESKLGSGSSFRVQLPCAPADALCRTSKPEFTPVPGRGRILIVDDHQDVRSVTSCMLSTLGYDVSTARDGFEAIAFIKENPNLIDLALIDVVMPGMSGSECLNELRKLQPELRAILATGYAPEDSIGEKTAREIQGFIQKPFQMSQLSEVIATALAGAKL